MKNKISRYILVSMLLIAIPIVFCEEANITILPFSNNEATYNSHQLSNSWGYVTSTYQSFNMTAEGEIFGIKIPIMYSDSAPEGTIQFFLRDSIDGSNLSKSAIINISTLNVLSTGGISELIYNESYANFINFTIPYVATQNVKYWVVIENNIQGEAYLNLGKNTANGYTNGELVVRWFNDNQLRWSGSGEGYPESAYDGYDLQLSVFYTIPEPCTSDWVCLSHGTCQITNISECTSIQDIYACGNTYLGNYSEFEQACVYSSGGGLTPYTPSHTASNIPAIPIDFAVEAGITLISIITLVVVVGLTIWVIKARILQ